MHDDDRFERSPPDRPVRARPAPDAAATDHALGPWRDVTFRTVADPRAARLLADPSWRLWIEPFLGRASGIAEAAARLDRPLDAVRYRVRRMHELGLLEIIGERRRAGRPVRLYRTVADGFVVPFAATPYADVEERLLAALVAEAQRFARSAGAALRDGGIEARRIYRAPDGTVHDESAADDDALVRAADADPIESLALDVRLPRSVARRLLRELIAFARRAEALEREPGDDASGPVRTYAIGLRIAPVPSDEERGERR